MVAFAFATLGIIFSNWLIHIPYVVEKLNISESQLGIALFFFAVGALIIMPISSKIIGRFGEGRVTFFGVLLISVFMTLPLAVPTYFFLCLCLFFTGLANGLFDISINAMAATVEKSDKVHIMSAAHGFFSLGGMLGSYVGSFLTALIQQPVNYCIIVCLIIFSIHLLRRRDYFNISSTIENKGKRRGPYSIKVLLVLAIICLFIMLIEGGIADWSALYLKDIIITKEVFYGFGFGTFSLAMASGRFMGDGLANRFGSRKLLFGGLLTGSLGLMATSLTQHLVPALAGFAICGMGFSIVVPILFRLAANKSPDNPSAGVAFVAGFGYVGFLAGPAILGLVAEAFTLRASFLLLFFFAVLAGIAAVFVRRVNQ
jgi:MFS family permease